MPTDTPVTLTRNGHLPCGNVPFHKGVCRDAYLGRQTCEHCEPLVKPDADKATKSKTTTSS